MLNSCFRFRCAIVQAGSVVIFLPLPHPVGHLFHSLTLSLSLFPPTCVVRFEAFLAWLSENYFANKFLLHFGVQFECGLHVNASQRGMPGLPSPCLTFKLLAKLCNNCHLRCRRVRQCTMWSVVQLLRRVNVYVWFFRNNIFS